LLEQNVDVNKIDTLLITHLHGDHFLDIPFMIIQRKFNKSNNELHIYGPKGLEETIGKVIKLMYSDISDWTVLRDAVKVKFMEFESLNNKEVSKGYFVDSYDVVHSSFKPAYGYTIKSLTGTVGISGDSAYCESIEKITQNSDIAVLDMSNIDGNDKHMGVYDIENLLKKYNKRIIATHMNKLAREYALENKMENLIVPNDGEEFFV